MRTRAVHVICDTHTPFQIYGLHSSVVYSSQDMGLEIAMLSPRLSDLSYATQSRSTGIPASTHLVVKSQEQAIPR